ncbi:MAG: beta-propeller fold lactonase family protein [Terracidiphilus sp.]
MSFNRSSQLVLVSAVSLLAAGLVTACSTLTVDFVYVTSALGAGSNNYGEVDVFEINSESGRMRQIPTSPFPSAGRNPVAEAASADNTNLYVVNRDDNTIVQFAIGNDGKLYPQNTVNTPGVFPMAVNVTGSSLYVVDTYQPLPTCSTAAPCSGSIAAYPINKDDSLGTPVANASLNSAYWPLTLPASPTDVMTPMAVTTAASGAYVYVTASDSTNGGGYIFGFAVNSDGTLAPMNGGVPFAAGVKPSAIVADPSGNYVYVTDATKNQVLTFQVNDGLLGLMGNPASTGNVPGAIVVDGSGKYAYVANSQDGNLSAYSIYGGVLTWLGTYTTGTQPVAIGIDPSLNEYLYTANYLDATVSGFQINPTDGSLLNSQSSPSVSNALPTAVAAIPHGSPTKK